MSDMHQMAPLGGLPSMLPLNHMSMTNMASQTSLMYTESPTVQDPNTLLHPIEDSFIPAKKVTKTKRLSGNELRRHEERLAEAVEYLKKCREEEVAISKGDRNKAKRISYSQVISKFNLRCDPATLSRRFNRKSASRVQVDEAKQFLSAVEETMIITIIATASKYGTEYTKPTILDLVDEVIDQRETRDPTLVKKLHNNDVKPHYLSKSWVRNFIKRNEGRMAKIRSLS